MSYPARGQSKGSADASATAVRLLRARRRTLLRAAQQFEDSPTGARGTRAVHEVRVACRRAAVAIDGFRSLIRKKDARRAVRVLAALRRACGATRDADVLLGWIKNSRKADKPPPPAGLDHLQTILRDRRRKARAELIDELPKLSRKMGKRLARVCDLTPDGDQTSPTMGEVAKTALEAAADRVLAAAAADLSDATCLHGLRIACKRLRYGIEMFQPVLGKRAAADLLAPLAAFQEHLGGFTDASIRTEFIEGVLTELSVSSKKPANRSEKFGESPAASLRQLLRHERAALRRGQKEAIQAWREIEEAGLIQTLRRSILSLAQSRIEPVSQTPMHGHTESAGAPEQGAPARSRVRTATTLARSNGHAGATAFRPGKGKGKRRLAAIDIGTNSIRLIVAEAAPDGTYRVLDDEKEITRLGRGLHKSRKLDPATQEHSAVTIARMKSIAEGYGSEQIRVVATAACREAKNAAGFIELVKDRSGLEIEVIGPEEEALLAYRSAAGAFNLAGIPAAVVDIGGGSLEVVLSTGSGRNDPRGAGLGGGIIERVHSLPLGAVRLTEQFGGAEHAGGKRFREMIRFIRNEFRESIGKPPLVPQLVVGTGGTITTLATVTANKELGPAAAGLLSGAVQGREIRRSDLRHALEYLRKLSVKDRSKVPGLPADRADIIVAGLAVIDELLGFLRTNSLFVHEGGIRDGLLLAMVRPAGSDSEPREISPLRGVKRFAKACNYEASHAGHVTRLCLRIFDQLGAQTEQLREQDGGGGARFDSRDRLLLEAAALLHDVGYLVNYASHHKHSYHLIVHAELPGFTSREVQVIANVARYHRAAEPKASHRNFATLSREDQQRTRVLAAILRIADGLDRTHMQQVRDVQVRLDRDAVHLNVIAASEPAVDIWGSARKSRLFERVFSVKTHFSWSASGQENRACSLSEGPVSAESTSA